MKKKTNGARRALAFLLTLALVGTYSVPMSVFGAKTVSEATGSAGQIVSSGTEKTTEGGLVGVTKSIVGTNNENEFDITLKVVTKNKIVKQETTVGADVVIVFDKSGSMNDNYRLSKAKKAAQGFVNAMLTSGAIAKNRVALVTFSSDAYVTSGFSDNAEALNKNIDRINASGGTNIQDGIRKAQSMLDESESKNKYIVLMSDGAPTYSYKATGVEKHSGDIRDFKYNVDKDGDSITGNGNDTIYDYKVTYNSNTKDTKLGYGTNYRLNQEYTETGKTIEGKRTIENHGIPTISQAIIAKSSGINIYSIACEVGDDKDRGSDEEAATSVLLNCSTVGDFYFDVKDANELNLKFEEIAEDILQETKAWTVTDPMGEFTKLAEDVNRDGAVSTDNTINWNLKSEAAIPSKKTVDGVDQFTYTLTYRVVLDTEKGGFEAGKVYDTNGTTTLVYSIGEVGKEGYHTGSIDFNVPTVKGEMPSYDDLKIEYYITDVNDKNPVKVDYKLQAGSSNPVTVTETITKGTEFGTAAVGYENYFLGTGKALSAADFEEGVIQTPTAKVVSGSSISVYYKAIPKYGYTVEYYRQATGSNDEVFIASEAGIKLAAGATVSALSKDIKNIEKNRPTNYSLASISPDKELTITSDTAKNVIKVVYKENTKNSYRVESYITGETTPFKTTTPVTAYEGTNVKLDPNDVATNVTLYEKKYTIKADYETSLTISAVTDKNVFKLYYNEDTKYGYTVKYFKGKKEVPQAEVMYDNAGYAGTTASAWELTTNSEFKNWTQDTVEYVGAENGEKFITLKAHGNNVINVIYKEDAKYSGTIQYWKQETGEKAAKLTSAAFDGKYYVGDTAKLTTTQRDAHLPKNYTVGEDTQTSVEITNDAGKNVINVYYIEDAKYGYTVEYYVDGIKMKYTDPEASNEYYAGKEITKVKSYKSENPGYTEKITWPNGGDDLIISATGENKIIVEYFPTDGIEYTTKVYQQKADGSYKMVESTTGAGLTNATFSGINLKEKYDKAVGFTYAYSTGQKTAGEAVKLDDCIYTVAGDGSSVLKMYFNQVGADLTVKHNYGGNIKTTKEKVKTQVGSVVTESLIREYGFKLDRIEINGMILKDEDGKLQGYVSQSMDSENMIIEFFYIKGEAKNLLIHHYDGDGTTITDGVDVQDESALNNADGSPIAKILTDLVDTVQNTYKAVGIWYNQKVIPMIIIELQAAVTDAKTVYDEKVTTLDESTLVEVRKLANDNNEIATLSAIKVEAENAYTIKHEELKTAANEKHEIATLSAIKETAETIFNTSNAALEVGEWEITPEDGEIPAVLAPSKGAIGFEDDDIVTTGALADKKDAAKKALDEAETKVDTLKTLAENIDALQTELNDANDTLATIDKEIAGTEKDEEGNPIMVANPDYTVAEEAVEEATAKVKAAQTAGENLVGAKDDLEDAQKLYDNIVAYEEVFLQLRKDSGLGKAEADLEKATADATTEALENAAKSDERKALDAATKKIEEAQAKADGQYDDEIFQMIKEDPTLAAYADAYANAKDTLKTALAKEGDTTYDMDSKELIEFLNDHQYTVNIVYEKVGGGVSDGGGGNTGGGGGGDYTPPPVIIEDEETPLAEAPPTSETPTNITVIEDEAPPLAELPKTGGLGSAGFLSIGAILAALGLSLRRKESK